MSHMVEVEIYARDLREVGKILEAEGHFTKMAGLRYKVDKITVSFTWSSINRR